MALKGLPEAIMQRVLGQLTPAPVIPASAEKLGLYHPDCPEPVAKECVFTDGFSFDEPKSDKTWNAPSASNARGAMRRPKAKGAPAGAEASRNAPKALLSWATKRVSEDE